jgi:TPR repeat protein
LLRRSLPLISRAQQAGMLHHGREGVPSDASRGRVLAQEGVRLGCHHCQGVMANISQVQESSLPLELARVSAARGSKFGQYMLGYFYQNGRFGLTVDFTAAVKYFQLALAHNYCEVQYDLGFLYDMGIFVEQNYAEASRL